LPSEETRQADKSYLSFKGELARKAIHLTSLVIPVGFFIFNHVFIIAALAAAFLISATFDFLRLFGHFAVRDFLSRVFGFMIRPREQKSFSGSTTILFAALLVYLFYDLPVAAAAMIIIVLGDTAAAIIGRLIGKIRLRNNKSLEGTLAFVIFATAGVLLVPGLEIQIGIIGALTGALFEALPIPIDDNISVPLVAGGLMQIIIANSIII